MNYFPNPQSSLYLANVKSLYDIDKPDVKIWYAFYSILSHNVPIIDRCEKITTPYNFKLYKQFKMPTDLTGFQLSYEDCCMLRAEEILKLSQKVGKKILILYSGGIDSTLVVIIFLKLLATKARDNIIIAMSPEGIKENAKFYYDHILGNFDLISSENFDNLINGEYLVVGGEHNDQLFGSDLIGKITRTMSFEKVSDSYKNCIIKTWLQTWMDYKSATWWFDMLVWHAETSPCSIKTNIDLLWWFNFNFKWQSVYFRILLRVSPKYRHLINENFLNSSFIHFYSSTEFQKWSMLNPKLKIKNSWNTYKFHAKDIIYDYNKDEIYREGKLKRGSLIQLFILKHTPIGLTDKFEYLYNLDKNSFYNSNNNFRLEYNV